LIKVGRKPSFVSKFHPHVTKYRGNMMAKCRWNRTMSSCLN